MVFFKILGAVLALAIGLYLGGAGQYRPDPDEIDNALLGGGGASKRAKRHFTPLGWLRQTQERSSHQRRRSRGVSTRRFDLTLPGSKKE